MPGPFFAVTDNSGRIEGFGADFSNEVVRPEHIHQYTDGDERVIHKGVEYDLTVNGCLVPPSVEVHESVRLGTGVLIEEGTRFHSQRRDSAKTPPGISINHLTRVGGTEIFDGVSIGRHALILASSMGEDSTIGDHSRIGAGTILQSWVMLATSVKVDRESILATGVKIETGARLGYKTNVSPAVKIGRKAKIGYFTGDKKCDTSTGGVQVRRNVDAYEEVERN